MRSFRDVVNNLHSFRDVVHNVYKQYCKKNENGAPRCIFYWNCALFAMTFWRREKTKSFRNFRDVVQNLHNSRDVSQNVLNEYGRNMKTARRDAFLLEMRYVCYDLFYAVNKNKFAQL